jgi:hypothetical protein
MSERVKDCPRCGKAARIESTTSKKFWLVICGSRCSRGPVRKDFEKAVAVWNGIVSRMNFCATGREEK